MAGTKRGSPGADNQKNPLHDVEITDEAASKLGEVAKEIQRAELVQERNQTKGMIPPYSKRRSTVKEIAKFWPVALMNHGLISLHAQHNPDVLALSYLEDLWIERDPDEFRCFTLEFYFKENPYFSDSVLKKEFKYVPPPAAANETADADGIKDSMLDFSWERDVKIGAIKINWKDDSKNLPKLYPRVLDDEEVADAGSFFNFFEQENDPMELGLTIATEVFPDAIDYFLGRAGGDDFDEDSDEEDEEDEEDAEEIDLEKPRSKKQKV